jgi:predicted secreted protein
MERSRRIALVAHCVLNANSKVEGLAEHAGVHPIVDRLAREGWGIVQLPCPELGAMGLKRWPQTKEQYDTPFFREHCERLADDAHRQVQEYLRCSYEAPVLIGWEGSPSCGVAETSSGSWGGTFDGATADEAAALPKSRRIPGSGVFMEVLRQRLEQLGVEFVAVDGLETDALDAYLDALDD